MTDILSAAQAAKIMGCGAQKVREKIKRGKWPGTYIPKKDTGGRLDQYEININKLADFLCITREEAERRLGRTGNESSKKNITHSTAD